MEGKAMKKKIILFLSFLMIAMCLTGCSGEYVIQGEKLEEITQIANNVVNKKGYELPEGYEVSFPDNTTNAQIKIRDNTKSSTEYLDVIFDISTEEIKLVEISVCSVLGGMIFCFAIFGAMGIIIIYFVIYFIKLICKKIIGKIKTKKKRK